MLSESRARNQLSPQHTTQVDELLVHSRSPSYIAAEPPAADGTRAGRAAYGLDAIARPAHAPEIDGRNNMYRRVDGWNRSVAFIKMVGQGRVSRRCVVDRKNVACTPALAKTPADRACRRFARIVG